MPSLLKPATSFTSYRDLRYGSASPGRSNLLDVHVPNNKSSACPCVIYVHGGGWSIGDKATDVAWLAPMVMAGFVVVCANYRLSSEARWPAQIIDVKKVIRSMRGNAATFHIWPNKIGIRGESAGGHLAAMCAVTNGVAEFENGEWTAYSSKVDAVAPDYAPTDLPRWVADGGTPAPSTMVTPLLGGTTTAQSARATNASPKSWVTAGDPPHRMWHGDADITVPLVQSQRYQAALQAAGVEVSLAVEPGMAHGDKSFYTALHEQGVISWFDSKLRP